MFPVKCLQLRYFKYLSKWISKFFPFLKVIFQFSAAKVWGCVVEWDIYCMTNSRQNTLTRPTADYLFDFGVTLCYCSKDIFMAAPTLKTNSNFLFKHQLSGECLTYTRWGLCLSLFLVSPAAFDLLNLHCFDAGLVQVGNGRVVTRARYFIIDQLEWLPVFLESNRKIIVFRLQLNHQLPDSKVDQHP